MYICPTCNETVPPGQRCPKGHRLFDWHIIDRTRERGAAPASFLGLCVAIASVALAATAAMILAVVTGGNTDRAGDIGAVAGALFVPVYIVLAARRARHWKRRGGAAARLAPHAAGMAAGAALGLCIIVFGIWARLSR